LETEAAELGFEAANHGVVVLGEGEYGKQEPAIYADEAHVLLAQEMAAVFHR
jgi:hypothetical protein